MKSIWALAAILAMTAARAAPEAPPPRADMAVPDWLQVNGVSLRYQVTGHGKDTILLLPSTNKPLEYWDEIVPALAARGRKILRYDMRGVGLSSKLTHPIRIQDEVDDLKAVLDTLGIEGPVMMIGTAFGGSVEMQFAAQFPQRVKAIVNISPSAQLVATEHHFKPATPGEDPHAFTYPVELRTNPTRWRRYQGLEASNDPVSRGFQEQLIFSTAFADVMPKIPCTVLMVATERYRRRTPEQVKALAATLPHGQFKSIDSGHDAPLETPERVIPVLRDFLRANGF